MKGISLLEVLGYVWAAFGIYWLLAGVKGKAAQTSEPQSYRFLRLGILTLVFLLLLWSRTAIGFLGQRFLPAIPAISYVGFAVALSGLAIALWARIHLGQYWSDQVVLKGDHQLIRSGPYAYMRHPIYSGVLLGVLGTAVVLDQWRGLLAFVILLANYSIKAKKEEQILATHFGDEFREHLTSAGFLLPSFRNRK
jgi:protein-S-isoprenylcysteine O-methyltransferase Ste14